MLQSPSLRVHLTEQLPRSIAPAGKTDRATSERPSIAVLPFADMSGDPEQEISLTGFPRTSSPDLERFMTKRAQSQVIELPGSHAIFLSHAPEVAALIEKAATAAE